MFRSWPDVGHADGDVDSYVAGALNDAGDDDRDSEENCHMGDNSF